MKVDDYYQLATTFSQILRGNGESEISDKLDSIIRNEDEESPRVWVPKIHSILEKLYLDKVNCKYSKELLEILVAGESSKKYWE